MKSFIIPEYKTVVFPDNAETQHLMQIPTAKKATWKGKQLILIPHKVTETIQLNILGQSIPSPIWYYYNWSGLFDPMEHQRMTAAFLTTYNQSLVLNDIGTGKTLSALWAADFLMQQNMVKKWVILAPLSTLQTVWGNALFTHFPQYTYSIVHGTRQTRIGRLRGDYNFYILNHNGLGICLEELISRPDIGGVIFDEATILRNRKLVFKQFKTWARHVNLQWRWLMTGTPTPNEPTDAWALAHSISSPTLGDKTYTRFRNETMMRISEFGWEPRPDAVENVSKVLVPAIRYKRANCVDLKAKSVIALDAEMTPAQKTAYTAMERQLLVEYEAGEIIAANEAVKMMKLCQIAAGCLYDTETGNVELYPPKRKLQALKQVIDEDGGKVIVFINFTKSIPIVQKYLGKFYTTEVIYSKTTTKRRNEIFNEFQTTAKPRVLIAHPDTMAHGITLTAAHTIIWFTPTQKNEIYEQANGRIERIGQEFAMTIVHLISSEVERRIFARLESKQKLQGLLLDLLQTKEVA